MPYEIGAMSGVLHGKYYFLTLFDRVERFDSQASTWKDVSPPHVVSVLNAAPNPATLTAFKAQGVFSKLSVSVNAGDSWIPMETPSYPVVDIRLEGTQAGFASRIDMGAFSSGYQFVRYDAATKAWPTVWTAPPGLCMRTLRDQTGTEKFCVSPGGSIFRIDGGKPVPEFAAN
jgi:hypothetical protein